ncbi:hypothetical protein E2562_035201 [Oryza meyeriana var. granulata]|uniref:Uncharacterized protein n=1 Tax=Oryza meyeriana var. granulata TaxID=110450 RepID=A0A6G1DA74_9ORYZ|nr:hypothetical protein E2562_035201 [Oryza meyeriana var. granulata]
MEEGKGQHASLVLFGSSTKGRDTEVGEQVSGLVQVPMELESDWVEKRNRGQQECVLRESEEVAVGTMDN